MIKRNTYRLSDTIKERGQGLVEFALILALISVVGIASLTAAGNSTKGAFTDAAEGFGGTASVAGSLQIAAVADQNYTGQAITPEPEVSDKDGNILTNGTDFIFSYENNINPGTAKIAATGKGGYAGLSAGTTFKILPAELTLPVQSGTLTYTGNTQTPSWSNYDSEKLSVTGDMSAKNAGTYTATFTPKQGYAWADGTSDGKSVTWVINKAENPMYVTPTSFTLTYSASDQTQTLPIPQYAEGEVTYEITKQPDGNYLSLASNSSNTVTIKGGMPVCELYIMKITTTAAGNENYNSKSIEKQYNFSIVSP